MKNVPHGFFVKRKRDKCLEIICARVRDITYMEVVTGSNCAGLSNSLSRTDGSPAEVLTSHGEQLVTGNEKLKEVDEGNIDSDLAGAEARKSAY